MSAVRIQIIPAEEKHIPAIIELWKEFMDFHSAIDPFLQRSADAHIYFEKFLRENIVSPDAHLILALADGEPAGYTLARINSYPPIYNTPLFGYICDMAVAAKWRRRGIGEKMLKPVVDWFAERGIKRIQLNAVVANPVAFSFWTKMGFEPFSDSMVLNWDKYEKRSSDSPRRTERKKRGCLFCQSRFQKMSFLSNELAYAVFDQYPVTQGHALIIPRAHAEDYFGLSADERNAIDSIIRQCREMFSKQEPEICGYNIGVNCGAAAGQTIMHCHIHLIPRRKGDMKDPRGGVRGVIPKKMKYYP